MDVACPKTPKKNEILGLLPTAGDKKCNNERNPQKHPTWMPQHENKHLTQTTQFCHTQ